MNKKLLIAIDSNDIKLSAQLASVCDENDFSILFANNKNYHLARQADCIVLDFDDNIELVIDKCRKDYNDHNMILGVTSSLKKSVVLQAKNAGCFLVLTKSSFCANLVDIIKKGKNAS